MNDGYETDDTAPRGDRHESGDVRDPGAPMDGPRDPGASVAPQGVIDWGGGGPTLEDRLRSTMAAFTTGAEADDATWTAIVAAGRERRRRHTQVRTVAVAVLAAAAVLATVFVVRVNRTPTPKDKNQAAATQPDAGADTNRAITDLSIDGIKLAAALEKEERTTVRHETGAPNEVAPEQLIVVRASTDKAAQAWLTELDGSPALIDRGVREATDKVKSHISGLVTIRQSAPTTPPSTESVDRSAVADLASHYADLIDEVRAANQRLVRASTSLPQWRELTKVQAVTTEAAETSRIAVMGLLSIDAHGDATLLAKLIAAGTDLVRAQNTFAALATDEQQQSKDTVTAGLVFMDDVHQLTANQEPGAVVVPLDATRWDDGGQSTIERLHAIELAISGGIAGHPAASTATMAAGDRAAILATFALGRAVDDELLATAGARTTPPADPAMLAAARAVTDRAVQGASAAIDASGLVPADPRLALATTAMRNRAKSVATATRAAADRQPSTMQQIANDYLLFTDEIRAVDELLAWHAGSVPELVQFLTAQHLAEATSDDVAVVATGVVALDDLAGSRSLAPLSVAQLQLTAGRAADAMTAFDDLATDEQQQTVRTADAQAVDIAHLTNDLQSGVTTEVAAAVHANSVTWIAARHDAEAHILDTPTAVPPR